MRVPGLGTSLPQICHPPEPDLTTITVDDETFPDAGSECMDSTLTVYLDVDEDGTVDDEVGLSGPVCVERSAPYIDTDGLRAIDTVMVSLDLVGFSHLAGAIEVRLAPGEETLGKIKQSEAAQALGVDLSRETPADSWFDVHFLVETEELGTSDAVGPTRVEATLVSVPPGKPNGDLPVSTGPGTGTGIGMTLGNQ